MARQIIWTERAQKERIKILTFWNIHNKSNRYSVGLNKLIVEALELISKYPLIGKPTEINNVRVKVLKNYHLIYEITPRHIVVLSLWDCRQKPRML